GHCCEEEETKRLLEPAASPPNKALNGAEQSCHSLTSARTDEQAMLSSILAKTQGNGARGCSVWTKQGSLPSVAAPVAFAPLYAWGGSGEGAASSLLGVCCCPPTLGRAGRSWMLPEEIFQWLPPPSPRL
uniref:Ragulator complex protein LAMTOR1 n=1 Tax=Pavo cristatus TaxID=9049 RepID=A0A8C9EKD4_PAVCR